MSKLIFKEFKLCMHPMVMVFLAFALMLLIPNYFYLVPCFFICNAIFYAFQQAVQNDDLRFTSLLPVSKADTVKAKYLFVFIIQMLMILLYAVMIPLNHAAVKAPNVSLDACPTLIGAALITFAVFDSVFLPTFFKTGVKAGRSFLIASIFTFIWIFICEGFFVFIGSKDLQGVFATWVREHLDCLPAGSSAWGAQLCAIAAGAVVYALSMLISMRRSIKNFEKVDL